MSLSPEAFSQKLNSSKLFKQKIFAGELNNAISQAQLRALSSSGISGSGSSGSGIGNTAFNSSSALQTAINLISTNNNLKDGTKQDIEAKLTNPGISAYDKFSIIQQSLRSTLNSDSAATLLAKTNLIDNMEYLRSALNDYYEAGGTTNLLTGNINKIEKKLGRATNTNFAGPATVLLEQIVNYRKALTGVAFGEKEGADIADLFPKMTNSKALNNQIFDARINYLTNQVANEYGTLLGKDGRQIYDELYIMSLLK